MIMMSWASGFRSVTRAAQCMWVKLLMDRDEKVPDDTIFNAPLVWSSPFPNANHPLCGTRSSDHIIHCRPIHSWHCGWWGSIWLKPLWRADSSCLKAAHCWHKKNSFYCLDIYGGAIVSETSYMETSMRKMHVKTLDLTVEYVFQCKAYI